MKYTLRASLLIALGLVLVSWALGPVPTGGEFLLLEGWELEILPDSLPPDPETSVQLRLPGFLALVDPLGRHGLYAVPQEVALGGGRFALYQANGQGGFQVRGSDGALVADHGSLAGLPYLQEHGWASVLPGGHTVRWYGDDGVPRWQRTFEAPLVGLEEARDGGVITLDLDSRLVPVGPTGEQGPPWIPDRDSAVRAAYALRILARERVLVVTGLDPQYLVALDLQDDQWTEAWSIRLGKGYPRDILLEPVQEGAAVLVEADDGFLLVNGTTGRWIRRMDPGWIRQVRDFPAIDSFALLRDAPEGTYLEFWAYDGQLRYRGGPWNDVYDLAVGTGPWSYLATGQGILARRWGRVP